MRIKSLRIHNYRSIRDLELECLPMVTLLGPNNHGKSNLLSALEFGLSTSAKPVEQDFFAYRDSNDNELWIEMTFHELTEQEKNTFKRYVLFDDTICIRKTARLTTNGIEVTYNGYVEQPNEEWLQAEKAGDYTSRDQISGTPLKDLVPQTGRLTKANIVEAQQKYIQAHKGELTFKRTLEQEPLLGQKNVAGGILPEFYLIPAVRDLTDEIKVKATTTFGRLLTRAVSEMAQRDPRFVEARKRLEEVVASLNTRDAEEGRSNQLAELEKSIEEELQSWGWGVKVNIEVNPPELERLFELGTDIHLNDGVETSADRKGHGLQRAMMFALLRLWAKVIRSDRQMDTEAQVTPRKQSDSVIFAMEEPELFLHPHAQRKLSASLREIAETAEHQVFVCTHSTHFVNVERYKEIAIITKENPQEGSRARQCTCELFEGNDLTERKKRFHMAQWINPDRGEMFFAKRVVFVEGETEKVIFPFLAEKLGMFDSEVSIIDCGSKHNLPLYMKIANAFKIPYLVIHDEDPLRDPIPNDWDENKKRRRTFELNSEIANLAKEQGAQVEILSPDFEGVSGMTRNRGEKRGKALTALDYFDSLEISQIPVRLQDIVRKIYQK